MKYEIKKTELQEAIYDCVTKEQLEDTINPIIVSSSIEFAKWCLRNVKKAPSGKKYVFKYQTKVVADEHTLSELYKVYVIDIQHSF